MIEKEKVDKKKDYRVLQLDQHISFGPYTFQAYQMYRFIFQIV